MTNANNINSYYASDTALYNTYPSYKNNLLGIDPFISQKQYTMNDVFVVPCGTKTVTYSGEGETEDMSKSINRKMLYFYDLKVLDLRPETSDTDRVVVATGERSIVVKEKANVQQQIIMKEMKESLAGVSNISDLEVQVNLRTSWYIEEKVD